MTTPDNSGGGQWNQPPDPNQPPPGGPGGYYGGPPGGRPIPNYLVWSILTTIFCCLPFGIVSIVFAAQVNGKQAAGDYAGALDASKKAKTWAIAAAVTGGVLIVLSFALGFAGVIFGGGTTTGFSY